MEATKKKIISDLLAFEDKMSKHTGEVHEREIDEVYKLAKTLCYVEKACEIMQKTEHVHIYKNDMKNEVHNPENKY